MNKKDVDITSGDTYTDCVYGIPVDSRNKQFEQSLKSKAVKPLFSKFNDIKVPIGGFFEDQYKVSKMQ